MKNTLLALWVVLTTLLTSCGYVAQRQNPQKYSKSITASGVKPLHIGQVVPVKSGAYHVKVYQRSVVFVATTRLIQPTMVEVFDVDHNNVFDVVYTYHGGVCSVGFTREFNSQYKTIPSSMPQKIAQSWAVKAAKAKRYSRTISPPQPPRTGPVVEEKNKTLWHSLD